MKELEEIDKLLNDLKEDILITKDSDECRIIAKALVLQRTAILLERRTDATRPRHSES